MKSVQFREFNSRLSEFPNPFQKEVIIIQVGGKTKANVDKHPYSQARLFFCSNAPYAL